MSELGAEMLMAIEERLHRLELMVSTQRGPGLTEFHELQKQVGAIISDEQINAVIGPAIAALRQDVKRDKEQSFEIAIKVIAERVGEEFKRLRKEIAGVEKQSAVGDASLNSKMATLWKQADHETNNLRVSIANSVAETRNASKAQMEATVDALTTWARQFGGGN